MLKLRYRHVKLKFWRVLSSGRPQRQYYTKYRKTRRREYWLYTGLSLDYVFWARMKGHFQRIYYRPKRLLNINYTHVCEGGLSSQGSYTVYMYFNI
jgi:hypothetical protein